MTRLEIGWEKNLINMQKISVLLSISLVLLLQTVHGQEAYAVEQGELLIGGYDPVAYFDQEVKKGLEQYATELDGRRLLFSSEENRNRFLEAPEKYTPAYGGWCAIAMVDKTFVVPDYTLYKIQDGDLLFFSVRAFFNGLTQWNKDADKNKVLADSNYTDTFLK